MPLTELSALLSDECIRPKLFTLLLMFILRPTSLIVRQVPTTEEWCYVIFICQATELNLVLPITYSSSRTRSGIFFYELYRCRVRPGMTTLYRIQILNQLVRTSDCRDYFLRHCFAKGQFILSLGTEIIGCGGLS